MRIGIYDPYLDSIGGGERYVLTIASYLSKENTVELFWNDKSILEEAEKKLNLDLSTVQISPNPFSPKIPFLQRILLTRKYDILIFLSDGSVPFLFAKKNIIIFQFPVNWVNGKSLLNKVKLNKIDKIICYSNFVKRYLDNTFDLKSNVLYPPVTAATKNKQVVKENIILSVGRFTKAMNMKKQEVLVESFIKLHKLGLRNWKLVLIGSYLPADEDFVESIKEISHDYPIEVITNVSHTELTEYYRKAKIYWHAAGFGEDLNKHPEYAEHFGITTVEAMGACVVPVVINAGGQTEIVIDKKNGFLWNDLDGLVNKTKLLIKDNELWKKMSSEAKIRAKDFSVEKFNAELKKMLL